MPTTLNGANDTSGCVFYDLDILGAASFIYTNFYGKFNVSHNATFNFAGDMRIGDNFILNVAGDVSVSDAGAFTISHYSPGNPYWDIAGNLTINGGRWNTISGSIKIYVEKDVNIVNLISDNNTTAYIILDGTTDQNFDAGAAAILPNYLQVNKSSGTAYLNSSGAYFSNVDVVQGTCKLTNTSSTYKFVTGKTTTVYNSATLTFEGTSALNTVTLREKDDAASLWVINNQAGSTVDAYFTDIKSSTVINPSAYAYDSINSGGNTNWIFVSDSGQTVIGDKLIDPVKIGVNIQI